MNSSTIETGIRTTNQAAASVWDSGAVEYNQISEQIADAIDHCVDQLQIDPAVCPTVIDIATGTGWTARKVSCRGAKVTGIDFSSEAIRMANQLSQNNAISFRVADAEDLPFKAASFDAVISTFGMMFCSDQQKAADEMARVCRPGGRMAIATWATHGGVMDMFRVIQKHNPAKKPGGNSPFDWGKEERIRELLEGAFDLEIADGTSFYPVASGAAAWKAFAEGYGPVVSLLKKLDQDSVESLRQDFEAFHEGHRTSDGIVVPRPYRVVSGVRRH